MRTPVRRTWRALAGLLLVASLLVAPGAQIHAAADQYDSQIAALRGQINSLRSQLGGVGAQQAAVANAADQMQQQIADTQTQLAATEQQLLAINAAIATTIQELVVVNQQLTTDKTQLAKIATSVYEMQSSGYSVAIVLNARSFSDLTQAVVNLHKVNGTLTTFTESVKADEVRLQTLDDQQTAQQAQVNATMASLQTLQSTQQTQEVAYQRESAQLTGQAGGINAQIAADQAKIADLQAQQAAAASASQGGWVRVGNALPPFAYGARFDAFPWGQCTWYVASLRDVSWSGDAWAWAGNARAQGMAEGMAPRVGAIVVWGAGNGYSGFGHVAYVVAVTSSTSFVVAEGNYLGLGIIDQRQVTSLHDVEAFIY